MRTPLNSFKITMYKRLFLISILIVLLSGDFNYHGNGELPEEYDFSAVVASIMHLNLEADKIRAVCKSDNKPCKNIKRFNLENYFTVMKHIAPPEGYKIDYIQQSLFGFGDFPILYFYDADTHPVEAHREIVKLIKGGDTFLKKREPLSPQLKLDGSPESYFEQFVFNKLNGQFNLIWHALINDTQIVTSIEDVRLIIASLNSNKFRTPLTEREKIEALKADVAPRVRWLNKDTEEVSVVFFTKWGGLYRETRQVTRNYPHQVIKSEIENIVHYDCGVIF